ncbi:hypothetical protein PFICI_06497 [Pestalotiopsis fici W106-1]|uniref:Peptidase M24 domain-containing protein n=1 Tax=Pestalotiopsis fici (strain W106-1 / CGMCC3.15140) TaxID=1229662 RepID=W3X616_PESFW|nr:uncharacterized protein PFICI_06497 [Pestalotiopsis fici W106-1]ETS81495.1 hypothetical protein PFICI_06497 [Pestalotiopsis fici W106-1]
MSVEAQRAASLVDAEKKALELFKEIEKDLIRPGIREKELNDQIHALGESRHGVRTHWHKRVIRSGPNTLAPFEDNPPDRVIEEDDMLVVDLGPVFEEWEADFGRTYVLGNDPHKKKLRDALEPIWHEVKQKYQANPDMTGEELYEISSQAAREAGFDFGAPIAGHIVGNFPHERIPRDKISLYITPGNNESLNTVGKDGNKRHWILEIHLRDTARGFGGFFEQILTAE